MQTATAKRGRPAIYTAEVVKNLAERVQKGGTTLKKVIAELNRKRSPKTQIKYVPLLVAMARLGCQLRPRTK